MKILIADDMPAWREFHKNLLEEIFIEQKCEIHLAISARDGLEKLYENTQTPYNLVITDLQMEDEFRPKYAGEWLVKQIKNLPSYKKTRIIISSGAFNINHIADSLNVECIPKRIACTDREAYENIITHNLT